MDRYHNFKGLLAHETEFDIELKNRNSPVVIVAPHGGNIEPHTTEITRLIAGKQYSYFCFNGMKLHDNRDLHITSHRFDEQQALALVQKSQTVITVHGCTLQKPLIHIGGLDNELKHMIAVQFELQGLPARITAFSSRYAGMRNSNICNRGRSGKGVQLEISRPLRDSRTAWGKIAHAVQAALKHAPRATIL